MRTVLHDALLILAASSLGHAFTRYHYHQVQQRMEKEAIQIMEKLKLAQTRAQEQRAYREGRMRAEYENIINQIKGAQAEDPLA